MTPPLPALDPRKAAIVALTPRVPVGAEIGADHGVLSAYLLKAGVCDRMVVADISAASLDKARRLFVLHGLLGRAAFHVADGLAALGKPVGAVVVAGLGGRTMVDILARGLDRVGDAALVLQPNTDLALVRRFLAEHSYRLDAERVAWDGKRYYVVLRALRGEARYTEKDLLLGPRLLRERPHCWWDYLAWRRVCLLAVQNGEENRRSVGWIEEELKGS